MSKRHKNPVISWYFAFFLNKYKIEFFTKKTNIFQTFIAQSNKNMSRMSYREVQQAAHRVSSDPELLRRHLWKTKPCHHGVECRNLEKCCAAHFAEEYRAPVCLHLEYCNRRDCDRYHPHLGSIQGYMEKMGISFQFATRNEWESQKSQNSRRAEVQKMAHEVSTNAELLKKHLYKTQPCRFGVACKNKENCPAAHFADEYRAPVCLHLEFCNKDGCDRYHPHMGTVQGYMEFKKIRFEFASLTEWEKSSEEKSPILAPRSQFRRDRKVGLSEESKERMFPIGQGGKIPNMPKRDHDQRRNTKMCRHASDEKMCPHMDCGFAHSLDELVLPMCPRKDCGCPMYHDGQDRAESAKRILKIEIEEWMLRPAHQNNGDLACQKMVREQIQLLAEDESEDARNMAEIEAEIEKIENTNIIAEIEAEFPQDPFEQFEEEQEEFLREQERAEQGYFDEDEDDEDDQIRVILGPITSVTQLIASENEKRAKAIEA